MTTYEELLEYVRHKQGCRLRVVPYKGYIDDDGSYQSTSGGFAVTNECTCGLVEMLERVKPPEEKQNED